MRPLICSLTLFAFGLTAFAETTAVPDERRNRNPLDQGADNCPATVIASLPYTDSGTTNGRANNFSFCGGLFSEDVIYQYTPTVTATYTLLLTNTYLANYAVNTGGACPGTTQVYCLMNSPGIPGLIDVQMNAAATYYIIVDGQDGLSGDYTLNISQACDSCEADSCPATLIPSLPYTDNGTTVGRTNNYSSPVCSGQNAPDVIYRMSVPTTQNIVARLVNEPIPGLLSLYLRSGLPCPGTNVECNIGGNGFGSSLSFQALANVTYYIVVDDISTRSGAYTLEVFPVCDVTEQPGDLLDCAPEIPGTPHQSNDCNGGCYNALWGGTPTFQAYSVGQTIFGRIFSYHGTQAFSDRDWFRFNLAQPCSLSVTVTAEFPWNVYVKQALCEATYAHFYNGPACSTVTLIEHSSPVHVLPAGNYEMWIESEQDTAMPDPLNYRLRVDNFPVCGEDGAIAIIPGSYSSNTCGEGDDCELDIQQQQETEDRLVRVDIPEQGNYTFSLCSSAEPWNSMLSLLTSCCGMNNLIAQDDDECGEQEGLSQINCLSLDAGSYFALVENNGNAGGTSCTNDFTLTVTPCPCPDVDSLTIEPFEETSMFLNFYVPTPGLVKFYYSTTPEQAYPTGYTLVDQFQANTAGRYNDYEIFAPSQTGSFVATLSNCQH